MPGFQSRLSRIVLRIARRRSALECHLRTHVLNGVATLTRAGAMHRVNFLNWVGFLNKGGLCGGERTVLRELVGSLLREKLDRLQRVC